MNTGAEPEIDAPTIQCVEVPVSLSTLHASNGDPLLLFGMDAQGWLFLWPTPFIKRHPIAFARWSRRNVGRFRGAKFYLQHELDACTRKWAQWLGVDLKGVV